MSDGIIKAMIEEKRDGLPIRDDGVRKVEERKARSILRAALEAAGDGNFDERWIREMHEISVEYADLSEMERTYALMMRAAFPQPGDDDE